MKKRLVSGLLACMVAASITIPAIANSGGTVPSAAGTEVWAGIVIEDLDPKIKVEVPTLFAFVVKGTIDADSGAVTSTNGDIFLPNVKVEVTTPSTNGAGAVYDLQTVGNMNLGGTLRFTNFSTYQATPEVRKGLEVKLNGNIRNEGDDASRKYWTHTVSDNTGVADFKKYNIILDGNNFDTVANDGLQMDGNGIGLAAPDTDPIGDSSYSNLGADDYAIVGETHYALFDVLVGGERGQYRQVEESAKIGNIVWTVSAEIINDTVDTAPNEEYLRP